MPAKTHQMSGLNRFWCQLSGKFLLLALLVGSGLAIASSQDEILPSLESHAILVVNQSTGNVLIEKNADEQLPIASITKLMTAIVVLDARLPMDEVLEVTDDDVDHLKNTRSRMLVGTTMRRDELLRLALMASENRAAAALGRSYPGGINGFVTQMNYKARMLGLNDTHYFDSTGLDPRNISSARDLSRLIAIASRYPVIRADTTTIEHNVNVKGRLQKYSNTNQLLKRPEWEIGLSKTGFINESGRCIVMQAWVRDQPIGIVLLDAYGKHARILDAQRIRKWLTNGGLQAVSSGITYSAVR